MRHPPPSRLSGVLLLCVRISYTLPLDVVHCINLLTSNFHFSFNYLIMYCICEVLQILLLEVIQDTIQFLSICITIIMIIITIIIDQQLKSTTNDGVSFTTNNHIQHMAIKRSCFSNMLPKSMNNGISKATRTEALVSRYSDLLRP